MSDDRHDKLHTPSTRAARPRQVTRRHQMASIASGLYDLNDLPPVHVTKRDYRRLRSLLQAKHQAAKAATLQFLAHELDRAQVHPATEILPDVVTLGTRVVFRADVGEQLECRALVYDETHSTIGGTVLVVTPLGVALLGLRAGSRMPYLGPDGRLRTASVESITSQPEAQERDLRHRYWPNPYADPAVRDGRPTATRLDRAGAPNARRLNANATRGPRGRTLPLSTELMQPSPYH